MSAIVWRAALLAMFTAVGLSASTVLGLDPIPLQSAYWRFEEGQEFNRVSPRNQDVVLDSINENHMRAFANEFVDAAPTYVSTVPPKPLKSGLPNTLALDFLPNQDIFTNAKDINNGIIEPGGGFTVEAAFYTYNPARWSAIIAKEGRPGQGDPDFFLDKLPTFALGAALAGFAGLMSGPLYVVEIGMGDAILIKTFVVIVIGVIGSIRGAFVAAVVVGMVDTFGRILPAQFGLPAALAEMAIYVLMAAVLFWRPRGLFPTPG